MKPILVLCVDSFAKNILLIRNHLGLTNEEFCRQFEMEQWMLERIENGDPYYGFDIYVDSFRKILSSFVLDGDKFIFCDISEDI